MRRTCVLASMILLALLVACGGEGGTETAQSPAATPSATGGAASPEAAPTGAPAQAQDDPVARAVEIAQAVDAEPDAAEEVLKRYDMTVEQFEDLMYEISADPELTRRFEAARAE